MTIWTPVKNKRTSRQTQLKTILPRS